MADWQLRCEEDDKKAIREYLRATGSYQTALRDFFVKTVSRCQTLVCADVAA